MDDQVWCSVPSGRTGRRSARAFRCRMRQPAFSRFATGLVRPGILQECRAASWNAAVGWPVLFISQPPLISWLGPVPPFGHAGPLLGSMVENISRPTGPPRLVRPGTLSLWQGPEGVGPLCPELLFNRIVFFTSHLGHSWDSRMVRPGTPVVLQPFNECRAAISCCKSVPPGEPLAWSGSFHTLTRRGVGKTEPGLLSRPR
jgi:hypothetical protein